MTTSTQTSKLKILLLDSQGDRFNWADDINSTGRRWEVTRAESSGTLLNFLKNQRYHAIVIASSMHVHAEHQRCFKQATEIQPTAVRIMLTGMSGSPSDETRAMEVAHRMFSDRTPIAEIAATIEYLIKITQLINKPKTKAFISAIGTLPSPPQVYTRLTEALNSQQSNARQIAEIIEQDPALVAKVLKVVNSAYFGLERTISNIDQAATLLGVRILRGLALAGHLANLYPQNEHWSSFSFERINERALLVARFAREIAQDMKANPTIQDQAFIGGLLHDLGILIIACHAPTRYRQIMETARTKNVSICVVEKAMLGFFHGEAAAYLLALWNIPPQVVEAVLLHHTPHLTPGSDFKPLTAVHIADALLRPTQNEIGCNLSTQLSTAYIQRLGLETQIPHWQMSANLYNRLKKPAS